jgi:glycosyltransferase involved in cell wall biosynthesis
MKNSVFPKISIITPSFNQGHFLEETINSIIIQNYPNIEYIIIDGGSTDNTINIIKKYQNFITYWVSEKDEGPSHALRKGLDMATGEIVCYLNSDDYFLPDTLNKISHYFSERPDLDIIYGHGFICDENSVIVKPIYSNKWNLSLYLHGYVTLVQQSTFFRSKAYQYTNGINTQNKTCWDGELWVDMSLAQCKFHRINEHLSVFRIHNLSITGSQTNYEAYMKDEKRIREKCNVKKRNSIYFIFALISDPIVWSKRLFLKLNGK